MLIMVYNCPENEIIWNPEGEFNALVESSWFQDPNVVKACEGIDRVEHIGDGVFRSPVAGLLGYDKLSGGAKLVTLCIRGEMSNLVYPLSWVGDNCYRFLSLVPENKVVKFYANSLPYMVENFGCTFVSAESGKKLTTFDDYRNEYVKYVEFGS